MQNLQKTMENEVDFLLADKYKSFLQVDGIFWMCVTMHAQGTQNKKFAIYLQFLKENVKHEVDFLPADKRLWFFSN